MKLNLDTIWNDTYRETRIVDDIQANMNVFSAIHSTAGPILRLEINTYSEDDTISLKCNVNLTPDQAEAMAAELLIAASKKREYDTAWAAHKATQQLAEAA